MSFRHVINDLGSRFHSGVSRFKPDTSVAQSQSSNSTGFKRFTKGVSGFRIDPAIYATTIAGLTVGAKQTSSFTALSNYAYEIESSSEVPMNLPASPATNDKVGIIITSSAGVLLGFNGNKINAYTSGQAQVRVPKTYKITSILLTYSGSTNGWTWESSDTILVTVITVPNQVTGLSATAGDTQVVLNWTAPSNGGSAITDYLVEYKPNSSGSWSTFADGTSTATTATVTGLTNGTAYDFRVSAINTVGTGSASATTTATPIVDPYAANVILFLKGDGANNSTTITDSSPSPKTITRYGDTKISTSQSKYGGSSIYFDGSGDYIAVAGSEFNLGTGDFTIEMWIYPISGTYWLGKGNAATVPGSMLSFGFSGNGYEFYYNTNSSISLTTSFTTNTWQHIAIVRNGTSLKIYKDGTQSASGTLPSGASLNTVSNLLQIGAYATGAIQAYIDAFRITASTARYTANFNAETDTYLNI